MNGTTSTGNQVAADLRAAADILRRDGWTQWDYEKPDGSKCARGALNAACGVDHRSHKPRVEAAYRALWRHLNAPPMDWNDDGNRTADEVIAALLAAADAAEAKP